MARVSAICAVVLALSVVAGLTLVAPGSGRGNAAATVLSAGAEPASADEAWTLTATDPTVDYNPTFVANGSIGGRIPAAGQGYSRDVAESQSTLAGFFAEETNNGHVIETLATIPTWSTLGFSDGSATTTQLPAGSCAIAQQCQAENGRLEGGSQVKANHSGYAGSGFVAGFGSSHVPTVGAAVSVEIANVPETSTGVLSIRYSAFDQLAAETLHVQVGAYRVQVSLPKTASWDTWATAAVPVPLTAGSSVVTIECAAGGPADSCQANIDWVALSTDGSISGPQCEYGRSCEAESSTYSGGAKTAVDHRNFSGAGFVAGLAAQGASLASSLSDAEAGPATLTLRYAQSASDTAQTFTVKVNGVAQTLSLPRSGSSWDSWSTVSVPVSLTAGTNTVQFVCSSGNSCQTNLDWWAVAPTGTAVIPPSGERSDYSQTLDMRHGRITTSYTWTSPAGRVTDVDYTVFASRDQAGLAVVQLEATPRWSGHATVTGQFDGTGADLSSEVSRTSDLARQEAGQLLKASQTGVTAAQVAALDVPSGSTVSDVGISGQSIGQRATFPVTAGQSYTVTKYVGIISSHDATAPLDAASDIAQAARAAGYAAVLASHDRAWEGLWTSDIEVSGNVELQRQIRASEYVLLASVRAGSAWSLSPAGSSSGDSVGYWGHTFWDTETWMYPVLLAQHPDIAESLNDYRFARLDAAEQLAADGSYDGVRFPWESAMSGGEESPSSDTRAYELHVSSDIALAQWQYYLATGDQDWLAERGWPVLSGVADFWVSRATDDGNGEYSLNAVMGPDERRYGSAITNNAYTNVSAATVLDLAAQAAALIGEQADPRWSVVAQGLRATVPVDEALGIVKEDDTYSGQTIKQADVVMLQYPWGYSGLTSEVMKANLDYYSHKVDTSGGPSMTDAIHTIDTLDLRVPGCSDYYYLQRSIDAFMRKPFYQWAEKRSGGAFTFVTGAGGFLQQFLNGYGGLRWTDDAIEIDPALPAQLDGITLTGLHWRGATFDLAINEGESVITVSAGTVVVQHDGAQVSVTADSPLVLSTDHTDETATSDVARCADVSSTSADVSYPTLGAVDGSDATAWHATTAGASLTVDLGRSTAVRSATVLSGRSTMTSFKLEVSTDGTTWQPLGDPSPASAQTSVTVTAASSVTARYVRYTGTGSEIPQVASLAVLDGLPGAPHQVTASATSEAGTTVSWTAPGYLGEGELAGYRITPYRDGTPEASIDVTAAATSARIDGLVSGADYTFTVAAIGALGTGPESSQSNAVRWTAPAQPGGGGPAGGAVTPRLSASAARVVFGRTVTLTAAVPRGTSGAVTFFDGARRLATAQISGTSARWTTAALTAGTHRISARIGTQSSTALTVVVVKARASKVKVRTKKYTKGAKAKVTVVVSELTNGRFPTGKVWLRVGKKRVASVRLTAAKKGRVIARIPKKYTKKGATLRVRAQYVPSDQSNIQGTKSALRKLRVRG